MTTKLATRFTAEELKKNFPVGSKVVVKKELADLFSKLVNSEPYLKLCGQTVTVAGDYRTIQGVGVMALVVVLNDVRTYVLGEWLELPQQDLLSGWLETANRKRDEIFRKMFE